MQRNPPAKNKLGDGSKLKIGIVVSSYNPEITDSLRDGALETLAAWKVAAKNIRTLTVTGSFELPYGCVKLLKKGKLDAIIVLGCIVKGETKHDEYIAHAVAQGIMQLSLEREVPIAFGVVTTNTLAQARARSRGTRNKGCEAALAALHSALL